MMDLHWEKSFTDTGYAVTMSGCADLVAAKELERLERQLRATSDIVINVAALEFADTTFLRFLIRLRSRAHGRDHANVKLTGVTRRLQRILEVTGLSRLFSYETAADVQTPFADTALAVVRS